MRETQVVDLQTLGTFVVIMVGLFLAPGPAVLLVLSRTAQGAVASRCTHRLPSRRRLHHPQPSQPVFEQRIALPRGLRDP